MDLITCTEHGGRRPWCVTCIHVFSGHRPIALYERSSIEKSGTVVCEECARNTEEPILDNFRSICDLCIERRIIPICGLLANADSERPNGLAPTVRATKSGTFDLEPIPGLKPDDLVGHLVKTKFVENGRTEWMWVRVTGAWPLVGILDNHPVLCRKLNCGDIVEIDINFIFAVG